MFTVSQKVPTVKIQGGTYQGTQKYITVIFTDKLFAYTCRALDSLNFTAGVEGREPKSFTHKNSVDEKSITFTGDLKQALQKLGSLGEPAILSPQTIVAIQKKLMRSTPNFRFFSRFKRSKSQTSKISISCSETDYPKLESASINTSI